MHPFPVLSRSPFLAIRGSLFLFASFPSSFISHLCHLILLLSMTKIGLSLLYLRYQSSPPLVGVAPTFNQIAVDQNIVDFESELSKIDQSDPISKKLLEYPSDDIEVTFIPIVHRTVESSVPKLPKKGTKEHIRLCCAFYNSQLVTVQRKYRNRIPLRKDYRGLADSPSAILNFKNPEEGDGRKASISTTVSSDL